MDVLDRIELCQQIIRQSGIEIRAEDLSGTESGVCELNGKKTAYARPIAFNNRSAGNPGRSRRGPKFAFI